MVIYFPAGDSLGDASCSWRLPLWVTNYEKHFPFNLSLEVCVKGVNIALGVVYCPHLLTTSLLLLRVIHHNLDYQDLTRSNVHICLTPCLLPWIILNPGFPHYDLVFLSYILKTLKTPPKFLQICSVLWINLEKLNKDVPKLDLEDMATATVVNDKVHSFNDTIVKLFDLPPQFNRKSVTDRQWLWC